VSGRAAEVWEEPCTGECTGDGMPRLVRRGEEADIVAAFAQAKHNATALWRMLCRLGLGPEVVSIAASLTEDNRPVTRLCLTPTGARLLKRLLAGGPAPPAQRAG
jgi:hypothetical protein